MPDNTCICCGKIIPEGRHICLACGDYDDMQTFHTKIRTNGDKLRSMTNRELAQYLETMERRALFTDSVTSAKDWQHWLESEVHHA